MPSLMDAIFCARKKKSIRVIGEKTNKCKNLARQMALVEYPITKPFRCC